MDVETVRVFFMWCTVINAVVLCLMFLMCAFAGDWIYRMHSIWFPISREAFNVALYSFLGLFKVLFWVFNLTPYLALVALG